MAIDTKHIQVFICRILKLSLDIFCRLVHKHPIVSSVLLFLFLLYLFLPKVFIFLIYSSPFLACASVYIKFFYLPSKYTKIQTDIVKDHVLTRNDASISQSQTLSQRNVKEKKNKELDAEAIGKTVLIEEKPRIHESISRNGSIGENIEPFGKASKSSVTSLESLEEQAAKSEGGGAELESSSSEEEEAKKVTNKAVEWNENDQKNLMDLGISELERNKRLESLIARRRARKLCKMNTEKILTSSHMNNSGQIGVSPVLVARGNLFGASNESDEKIPGSAPSLASRNPFDLPYDPFEEKPNLLADSFQQEFTVAHQKDMFFCRHESFAWGSNFPLEGKNNDNSDISGCSRFRREQDTGGEHDWLVDHYLNQDDKTLRRSLSITDLVTEEGESSNQAENQPEEDGEADQKTEIKGKKTENTHGSDSSLDKGNEIPTGTHGIKNNRSESSLSSLSDDNETTIKSKKSAVLAKIQPPIFKFPDVMNSPSTNAGPCPIPKARGVSDVSYLASPATIDRSRLDNHFLYTNSGPWHTPTNSIASDMQVEVSEVGSPPLTGDGSASSNDGESLTYDGDIEKEITSGSDEMWGVSPHAPKAQENEMKSRDVNDFSKEDNTEGGFSGFHKEAEAPFATSSKPDIAQDGKTDSISNEGDLHKPQESLNPSEKPSEEVEISYSVNVSDHTNDDLERSKSVDDRNSGAENSIMSEEFGNLSKPAANSESSNHIQSKSLNTPVPAAEGYSTSDPVARENVTKEDTKSNEDRNGIIDRYIEQEVLVDLSKRAEESISESDKNPEGNSDKTHAEQEQSSTEFEASRTTQRSNNPSTSGIQLEMAVEEASPVSSTSSSPKSVLPDRVPLAETSSDLNQLMQTDVSEYADEQPNENLVPTSNQNGHNLTNSMNHSSINMPQNSEEISNTLGNSTDEARAIANSNEPVLKEDIKSMLTKHAESEASMSNEDAVGLSKPPVEINSRSVEQTNGAYGNLTQYEARIDHSKPENERQDLKVSGLAVTGEESKNPSQESTQGADGNSGAKNLTENITTTIPTNPAVEGDHVDMPVIIGAEEQILPQNSTATKDVVINDKTSTVKFELVENGEHNSKGLDRKENTSEQSNITEDTTSGSIKVIGTGSSNFSVKLQAAGEGSSSNGMRNINDESKESSKAVEDMKGDSKDESLVITPRKKLIISKMKAPMSDDYEHIRTP